jgi:2,3-bisphosphoglycerate-independent phosphoglycerate mutase
VPFVVTSEDVRVEGEGVLADVVPTILELLAIEQPEAMTGRSLLG